MTRWWSRKIKIGLRSASDLDGSATFRALSREIPPVRGRSSMAASANRVTEAMNPTNPEKARGRPPEWLEEGAP